MTWHAEAEKEVRVGEYRRRSPEYMPVSRTSPKSVPVDALLFIDMAEASVNESWPVGVNRTAGAALGNHKPTYRSNQFDEECIGDYTLIESG
jgi:hypothetical protein